MSGDEVNLWGWGGLWLFKRLRKLQVWQLHLAYHTTWRPINWCEKGAAVKFLVGLLLLLLLFFLHSLSDLQTTLQLWRRPASWELHKNNLLTTWLKRTMSTLWESLKSALIPPLSSLLFTVLDLAACRGRSWGPITQNHSSPARGEEELGDWCFTGGGRGDLSPQTKGGGAPWTDSHCKLSGASRASQRLTELREAGGECQWGQQ